MLSTFSSIYIWRHLLTCCYSSNINRLAPKTSTDSTRIKLVYMISLCRIYFGLGHRGPCQCRPLLGETLGIESSPEPFGPYNSLAFQSGKGVENANCGAW
jgi:hypothetical protein